MSSDNPACPQQSEGWFRPEPMGKKTCRLSAEEIPRQNRAHCVLTSMTIDGVMGR